jgi:hypothetical protein
LLELTRTRGSPGYLIRHRYLRLLPADDHQPQFSDPSLFKQEFKRLKFGISKTEYSEQLNALKNFNQALTRLTKQSLELEPSRTEYKKACPNFSVLQDYARSLFETLRSGLRCGCGGHAVKLRLEHRIQRTDKERVEAVPFRVIFTYSSDDPSPSSSASPSTFWNWTEADIRCISDNPRLVAPSSGSNMVYSSTESARRVRFQKIQAQQNASSSTTVTIVEQQVIAASTITPEIQDLCKATTASYQSQRDQCIGFLTDNTKRKHGIYPLELAAHCDQQSWAAYSLRQVLTKRANINRRLTQLDKFRVAVDLASSVLQLYKTPWLDEQWSDNDVYFVHRPGVPLSNLYKHAFVYRELSSTPSAQKAAYKVIRNQTLFTLGILLTELLYGKSIEELQLSRDLNCQGTPGIAWCTAERLIEEEIEYEAGPRYLDAVRRCIRCDFNRKELRLDNEDF